MRQVLIGNLAHSIHGVRSPLIPVYRHAAVSDTMSGILGTSLGRG